MKTTLEDGRTVLIKFAHTYKEVPSKTDRTEHEYDKVTHCYIRIYRGEELTHSISASAKCSVEDTFVKAKGRELSFKRAMEIAKVCGMPRESRVRIWEAYLYRNGSTNVQF